MILLKLVNIFEGWIQESITKLLDTSSQLNTVNSEVAISELTTIIRTKDDKYQEICHFFCWTIKSVSDIYISKRRLQNGQKLLRKITSTYLNI